MSNNPDTLTYTNLLYHVLPTPIILFVVRIPHYKRFANKRFYWKKVTTST